MPSTQIELELWDVLHYDAEFSNTLEYFRRYYAKFIDPIPAARIHIEQLAAEHGARLQIYLRGDYYKYASISRDENEFGATFTSWSSLWTYKTNTEAYNTATAAYLRTWAWRTLEGKGLKYEYEYCGVAGCQIASVGPCLRHRQ